MGRPTLLASIDWRETSGVDHPANEAEGWMVLLKKKRITTEDLQAALSEQADGHDHLHRLGAMVTEVDWASAPSDVAEAAGAFIAALGQYGYTEKADGAGDDEGSEGEMPMAVPVGQLPKGTQMVQCPECKAVYAPEAAFVEAYGKAAKPARPGETMVHPLPKGAAHCPLDGTALEPVQPPEAAAKSERRGLVSSLLEMVRSLYVHKAQEDDAAAIQSAIEAAWPAFVKEVVRIKASSAEYPVKRAAALYAVQGLAGSVEAARRQVQKQLPELSGKEE